MSEKMEAAKPKTEIPAGVRLEDLPTGLRLKIKLEERAKKHIAKK